MRNLLLCETFVEETAKEFGCTLIPQSPDAFKPEYSWCIKLNTGIKVYPKDNIYGDLVQSGILSRYETRRKMWSNCMPGLREHSFISGSTHTINGTNYYIINLYISEHSVGL